MTSEERQRTMSQEFRRGRRETAVGPCAGPCRPMGSHTDYNMGYVLTMTINRDTWIAARPRADCRVAVSA